MTLYRILEIIEDASLDEIKSSYRRLVKKYHPDTGIDVSKETINHFQRIQEAYRILSHPLEKARYDQTLSKERRAPLEIFSCSLKISFIEACLGTRKKVSINGKKIEISIPPGTVHKDVLVLMEQDLSIIVYVASHPVLKRENRDILLDVPITFSEALSGGDLAIPTLQGSTIFHIPPAVSSGTIFVLEERGIPGNPPGNQILKIHLVPPKGDVKSLKNFLEKWEKSNPYKPRAF